jgi:hypothetical protein
MTHDWPLVWTVLLADAGILANVLHAHTQVRPNCSPAVARPSPVELSSKFPRSHTPASLSCNTTRPCLLRPLNAAHVVDLMTVNDLLVLHTVAPNGRRHPALARARCTSVMKRCGVAPDFRQIHPAK